MSRQPRFPGSFPFLRMRRMRRDDFSRRLMRETRLGSDDLIYPMFVCEGKGQRQAVTASGHRREVSGPAAEEFAGGCRGSG